VSYEAFPYKRRIEPNAAQKRYHNWILDQPCVVTGRYGVTRHHVTAHRDGGRFTRSHWIVVPLIRELHQHDYGKQSVERLNHGEFYEVHGVDLELAALHTLVRYLETEHGL
jgi:hypothetical protein